VLGASHFEWRKAKAWLLLACLLGWTQAAWASEGGGSNYTPGFYGDFGMAAMPSKGLYFYNFFAGYANRKGDTGNILEMPGFLLTTDHSVLGGRYIAGLFPGIMVALDHSGAKDQSRFGLGDAYVIPFGISWQWGDVSLTAFEGIVAPTGRFAKDSLNAGRNIWTFDHLALLTWNLPMRNELSLALGYMNNTVNPATHYQSGDELHFDYALGHYLQDDLGVGITGSYYRQLTPDHVSGRSGAAAPYSEFATIGPVLLFTPHIAQQEVTMSVKWLHEFNVIGRAAQNYLVWRFLVSF
jgi:hypothetical protein